MKRIIAVLFSVLLLVSPALCAAEDNTLRGVFRLERDCGYTMTNSDDNTYIITSPDGTLFMCMIMTCEELGIAEPLLRIVLPSLAGTTQEDIVYGDTIGEVNGFMYITMKYFNTLNGFAAVNCDVVLYVYCLGSDESIPAYEQLLRVLHPAGEEDALSPAAQQLLRVLLHPAGEEDALSPAAPEDPAFSGAEGVSGFYECELSPNLTMILSPGGYGRLNILGDLLTFDYEERDGQIVSDSDDPTFTCDAEGHIVVSTEGIDLPFIRRAAVSGEPHITGKWTLDSMDLNGTIINASLLNRTGIEMEFTVYDNGTIDCRYVNNDSNEIFFALGWGIDEDGLYLHNGNRLPGFLEDGILSFPYPYNGVTVTILFTRSETVE